MATHAHLVKENFAAAANSAWQGVDKAEVFIEETPLAHESHRARFMEKNTRWPVRAYRRFMALEVPEIKISNLPFAQMILICMVMCVGFGGWIVWEMSAHNPMQSKEQAAEDRKAQDKINQDVLAGLQAIKADEKDDQGSIINLQDDDLQILTWLLNNQTPSHPFHYFPHNYKRPSDAPMQP